MRALLVLVGLVGAARADEAKPSEKQPATLALAVNAPISWIDAMSIAGSAYIGVYDRHALRLNVARSDTWERLPAALLFGAEVEAYEKITLTLGAGWVFYPSERFRGVSFELGAFHRDRDISEMNPTILGERTVTDTQTYAAYGLVGYSLLIADHFMIAAALGGSVGYQYGTRTHYTDYPTTMGTTERISRAAPELEWYLRFGYAF